MARIMTLKKCNENILQAFNMAQDLIKLAEDGDGFREDESCGVLFGVIRDSGYKIKDLAEQEMKKHQANGKWK
jgi:hypothetical protein